MVKDKTGYQVNSSVIQAIGLVFFSIFQSYKEKGEDEVKNQLALASCKLGQLDYKRNAIHWKDCSVMTLTDKGYINGSSGGRTFREGIASYLCNKVGVSLKDH